MVKECPRSSITLHALNGQSTRNCSSSQQISSKPQMFSITNEFNSHVTRLFSRIQRSFLQSLFLTRNRGGIPCVVSLAGHDAASANGPVTAGELVITTRVGSKRITTIMLYSKEPFDEAFDALMTLRASNGRF